MLEWIRKAFSRHDQKPLPATVQRVPQVIVPRVPKSEPESLSFEYIEQLRAIGYGFTAAAPNADLLQDLMDWGYVIKTSPQNYKGTLKSDEEMKDKGAWSPDPDPRTDR